MSGKLDDSDLDAMLTECEGVIHYRFQDRSLLLRSLTHASIAKTRLDSNERLEFLGDSILGLIVCEMLFQQYPTYAEGELTRIKSIVVSRITCAKLSEQLDLKRFLFLGKGLSGHKAVPPSILAAVLEAMIAAIYLDGGSDSAREFVQRLVRPEIEEAAKSAHGENYKSQLQQTAQKKYGQTPLYRLIDEKGPDHSKCFNIAAVIGSRVFPDAWGPSKKEAEQNAALNALTELRETVSSDQTVTK